MKYKIIIKLQAKKELKKLQPNIAKRILAKIYLLAGDPFMSGCVALSGKDGYRIRIGDYRVIYEVNKQEITVYIIRIGHRRDVYRRH